MRTIDCGSWLLHRKHGFRMSPSLSVHRVKYSELKLISEIFHLKKKQPKEGMQEQMLLGGERDSWVCTLVEPSGQLMASGKESDFFKGVALGRLITLSWMIPHPLIHGRHTLNWEEVRQFWVHLRRIRWKGGWETWSKYIVSMYKILKELINGTNFLNAASEG